MSARDAVVAAALTFVGWEATSRREGVAAVVGSGPDLAAAMQALLAESQESNRLLRRLLVSTISLSTSDRLLTVF